MKKIIKLSYLLFIVLFAGTVSAQTNKFSHQNIKLECKTCHDCEIPTKENPCLTKCPRDKMPAEVHSPSEGPTVITMDDLSKKEKQFGPVNFSHKLHAEMSGMAGGCSMCHHYNPAGEVIGCKSCHELERKREDISKPDLKGAYHRQCMDCHRAWSHSVSCETCHSQQPDKNKAVLSKTGRVHPEIKVPDVITFDTKSSKGKIVTFPHSEHNKLFGLDCQSCHSDESCVKCHDTNKQAKPASLSLEQHHQRCSKCHDTKDQNNCVMCHDSKQKAPFNHGERTGWALNRFHQKLDCSRCHTEKGKFTKMDSKCSSCHGIWNQSNFDHKITGLALNETHGELECENCHTEPTYTKPDCSSCHDDKSFPKDKPGKLVK